jgi:lipid kinase YegS
VKRANNLHCADAPEGQGVKRKIALVVRAPVEESRLEELRAAVAAVRACGHQVRVRVTFEAGDARRYARSAALGGCDVVAAAGGDGTVNEVVNGLAAVDSATALAVVPMGTANDFARGLRLPDDLADTLRLAAEGRTEHVDVARVNRRCFINVSTGGFGAAATQSAPRRAKRRLGALAYMLSGARKLVRFEAASGVFRADGEVVHRGRFVFFAVGNARWTGGGTRVTPRADRGDGKLDIVVVTGDSRLDFLTLLPDIRAGTHLDSPDVIYLRADTLEVEAEEPIAVNADGEHIAGRHFSYGLLERMLPVVVGPLCPERSG